MMAESNKDMAKEKAEKLAVLAFLIVKITSDFHRNRFIALRKGGSR